MAFSLSSVNINIYLYVNLTAGAMEPYIKPTACGRNDTKTWRGDILGVSQLVKFFCPKILKTNRQQTNKKTNAVVACASRVTGLQWFPPQNEVKRLSRWWSMQGKGQRQKSDQRQAQKTSIQEQAGSNKQAKVQTHRSGRQIQVSQEQKKRTRGYREPRHKAHKITISELSEQRKWTGTCSEGWFKNRVQVGRLRWPDEKWEQVCEWVMKTRGKIHGVLGMKEWQNCKAQGLR